MTTLEILYATRDRLAVLDGDEPDWSFGEWTRCTCGHIYSQAMLGGKLPPTSYEASEAHDRGQERPWLDHVQVQNHILYPNKPEIADYRDALAAIAEAHKENVSPDMLGSLVSDLTASLSGKYVHDPEAEASDEHYLAAARELVQTTITYLETQQEADRKKLLAGVV